MIGPTLLVVAKAPVPGLAKTRIAATVGDAAAASIAAAALLDTLATVSAVGWPCVISLTGDLTQAARRAEIAAALEPLTVVRQRGESFGERLANAHLDADGTRGVVQIGMDTPQVRTSDFLTAGRLVSLASRVIGPAVDGGWWLLGLPEPDEARALVDVPMSQSDTGVRTELALGGDLARLRTIRDMDTWADALAIADEIPSSQLAAAVRSVEVMA